MYPPHRLSLFSYHQHCHRLPLFPLLAVGLGSSTSLHRRRPLLPFSPTTTPPPLSLLSSASSPLPLPSSLLSAACLFLSFTVAASFFVCQRRPPVSSLPHWRSFFSSASPLTSPSTAATAVAAAVRPRLSSLSSAAADCHLYCRRRSHPSPPPSLFLSCRHRLHPSPSSSSNHPDLCSARPSPPTHLQSPSMKPRGRWEWARRRKMVSSSEKSLCACALMVLRLW